MWDIQRAVWSVFCACIESKKALNSPWPRNKCVCLSLDRLNSSMWREETWSKESLHSSGRIAARGCLAGGEVASDWTTRNVQERSWLAREMLLINCAHWEMWGTYLGILDFMSPLNPSCIYYNYQNVFIFKCYIYSLIPVYIYKPILSTALHH